MGGRWGKLEVTDDALPCVAPCVQVGSILVVYGRAFLLKEADEKTLKFLEMEVEAKYPHASYPQVKGGGVGGWAVGQMCTYRERVSMACCCTLVLTLTACLHHLHAACRS